MAKKKTETKDAPEAVAPDAAVVDDKITRMRANVAAGKRFVKDQKHVRFNR